MINNNTVKSIDINKLIDTEPMDTLRQIINIYKSLYIETNTYAYHPEVPINIKTGSFQ